MNKTLTIQQRNDILRSMTKLIAAEKIEILNANKLDVNNYNGANLAMYDRLKVDDDKIEGMMLALQQLIADIDPVGKELYHFTHENGLKITNKSAP